MRSAQKTLDILKRLNEANSKIVSKQSRLSKITEGNRELYDEDLIKIDGYYDSLIRYI